MKFKPNKTSVEIIKEDTFGGTYFRGIFFMLMESSTENLEKNLICY